MFELFFTPNQKNPLPNILESLPSDIELHFRIDVYVPLDGVLNNVMAHHQIAELSAECYGLPVVAISWVSPSHPYARRVASPHTIKCCLFCQFSANFMYRRHQSKLNQCDDEAKRDCILSAIFLAVLQWHKRVDWASTLSDRDCSTSLPFDFIGTV